MSDLTAAEWHEAVRSGDPERLVAINKRILSRGDAPPPKRTAVVAADMAALIKEVAKQFALQAREIETLRDEVRLLKAAKAAPVPEAIEAHIERRIEDLQIGDLRRAIDDMLTYKGVYKSDHEYQRGQLVTHKGAMWLAQRPATIGSPGNSDHWRLVVKSAGVMTK
jgi:hypothetical protein